MEPADHYALAEALIRSLSGVQLAPGETIALAHVHALLAISDATLAAAMPPPDPVPAEQTKEGWSW